MTNKLTMISQISFLNLKLIVLASIFALLLSCQSNDKYLVNAFKINEEWGYCILKNNKIIIKQTTIPTYSQSVRFKNEDDALKVGKFVLEKLKRNLSPTVTKNDLVLLEITL